MSYARIVTVANGTVIRTVRLEPGQSTYAVNQMAATLESIISEDLKVLKIEVDYTGCDDSDSITHYDP